MTEKNLQKFRFDNFQSIKQNSSIHLRDVNFLLILILMKFLFNVNIGLLSKQLQNFLRLFGSE